MNPQDTPNGSRDLKGDPNDQELLKDIKDKVYPDRKMNGTYLITDLSQEAAIAKIILTTVIANLGNKKYWRNQVKLGVSAMKPELFLSLNLIVESIEN
jgi:hypothetical protein